MDHRMIFFFIPDLSGGGAERAMLNLLKFWPDDDEWPLTPMLVLRCFHGEYVGEVPKHIRKIVLNTKRSGSTATLLTVLRLGKELRRSKPAAIVSFLSAPAVVFAARIFQPSCKVVLSVQTSPTQWLSSERVFNKSIFRIVQKIAFRKADLLLPISEGIASELQDQYRLPRSQIRVINNSADLEAISHGSAGECPSDLANAKGSFRIITAGRLVRQKSQKVLIEAVAKLMKIGLRVELFILGKGPDFAFLKAKAENLGIAQKVHFLGFQANPWRYFRNADLFVLSSKYEGFANVIVEAMACGLPVLSTDAPHGPREILRNGESGVIVPVGDTEAITREMLKLIEDGNLRKEYAQKSLMRARDFDSCKISRIYKDTIASLLKKQTILQ